MSESIQLYFNQQLFSALDEGDLVRAAEVLDLGADIQALVTASAPGGRMVERTPLHHAVRLCNFEAVKFLIDNGASLLTPGDVGDVTPITLVERMMENRSPKSREGQALEKIAGLMNTVIAVGDLSRPTGRMSEHEHKKMLSHAFIVAMDAGINSRLRQLIGWGAPIGPEHLEKALEKDNLDLLQVLLAGKAKVSDGKLLHRAVAEGKTDAVKMLWAAGAGLEYKPDQYSDRPLHLAIKNDMYEIAQFLVNKGAQLDAPDNHGNAPLHLAVDWKTTEAARFLLDKGAQVDVVASKGGHTPLHSATLTGNRNMVQLLLDRGANPNFRDNDGRTSLHHAVAGGRDAIVLLLLEKGGDVGIVSKRGMTPLGLCRMKDTTTPLERQTITQLERVASRQLLGGRKPPPTVVEEKKIVEADPVVTLASPLGDTGRELVRVFNLKAERCMTMIRNAATGIFEGSPDAESFAALKNRDDLATVRGQGIQVQPAPVLESAGNQLTQRENFGATDAEMVTVFDFARRERVTALYSRVRRAFEGAPQVTSFEDIRDKEILRHAAEKHIGLGGSVPDLAAILSPDGRRKQPLPGGSEHKP